MKITILGSGASGGVPLITGVWGSCNPNNPKNIRTRSSILIQDKGKNILIDTSPDLRAQALQAGIKNIDAVFYTHAHADHIAGIDELRQIFLALQKTIPVYADLKTAKSIQHSFSYIFETRSSLHPPFLKMHIVELYKPFEVFGFHVTPFDQGHGPYTSLGYRIGDFAYSTDMKILTPDSLDLLKGLKVWVVGCLQEKLHISHANLEEILEYARFLKPEKIILTHLAHYWDYDILLSKLPKFMHPAYDGLSFSMTAL